MTRYHYAGLDQNAQRVEGDIEARSLEEAAQQVGEMGVSQSRITVAWPDRPEVLRGRRVSAADLIQFNTQLAAMARSGVPLDSALAELSREMNRGPLKKAIAALADEVRRGTPLDEAMARDARSFPPTYVAMVRAGLSAGNLPELLLLVNQRLGFQQEFRRHVVDAMLYPLMVVVMATLMALGALVSIVPSYRAMYNDFGTKLPLSTEVFLGLADVAPLLMILVLVTVAGVVLALLVSAGTRFGDRLRHGLLSMMPYYRRLRKLTVAGEFCAATSAFLTAGLTVPEVLALAARSTASESFRRAVLRAVESVNRGESLTDALSQQMRIPRLVTCAVRAAEGRGDLPNTLEGLAESYRRQGQRTVALARAVLPVVCIIAAGVFVALMVVSLMMPLVQIIQSVHCY